MKQDLITGAGGGGDKARTPVEARDNLKSKQFASITDILCEGEIVGLKNGLRSIYLNETPLQNMDGSFNFFDVAVQHRTGTVNQTPIEGVSGTEVETPVSTEILFGKPIVRSITNGNVRMARITINIPQLSEQDMKTGDLNGAKVSVSIDMQSAGGGYRPVITDVIDGKTSSKFQKQYLVPLEGNAPWSIRLTRNTPDSTTSALQNRTFWESTTEIVPARMIYPHSALVHTTFDAANFSSIPSRSFLIRGMIVKIPSNYNPTTRVYTGIWDGTFKLGWTDNPAWCYYDLLINERYGLGQYVKEAIVDKWSLYAIARYCDELVPDGRGSDEPRFTCNLYLQTREEALTVLQHMSSMFRAVTFWAGGTIMTTQDRPADPIAIFNNAAVADGRFVYAGTSLKQRHTVALVGWNDPNDFYRLKTEYVQDDDSVRLYGINETEMTAFGCTSQSQAHRLGKWTLAVERLNDETVSFKTGLAGCVLYPGAIFETSDVQRTGKRMGGRALAATASQITIDADFPLEAGHYYSVTVYAGNGVMESRDVTGAIDSPDGVPGRVLVVNPPFTVAPEAGAAWTITDLNKIVPEQWRVISIIESGVAEIEVTALRHIAGLYGNVERNIVIDAPPTSGINTRPPMPTDLVVNVSHYRTDGQITGLRALVSWTSTLSRFRVSWRKVNTAWQSRETNDTSIDIESVDAADYEVMVVAISATGRESAANRVIVNLAEKAADAVAAATAPSNLRLEAPYIRADATFAWDAAAGALGYEAQVLIRGVVKRTAMLGNALRFVYNPDMMREDGGPYRTITFRVRALGAFGAVSAWVSLDAGNPQVGQLQGIELTPGIKMVFFNCAEPADEDFAGIMVWFGTTPDFAHTEENKVYDGAGTHVAFNPFIDPNVPGSTGIAFDPDRTYYVRAAGYDAIGKDSLNVSSSLAIKIYNNAPDKDSIIADMIKDGALEITKFADGIEPVGIVTELPALNDPAKPYKGPKTILLGDTLYMLVDGKWVPNDVEIEPGSISLDKLDPILIHAIEKIEGPATLPGTIAFDLAEKVRQTKDLIDKSLTLIGSKSEIAVAAAQTALSAITTATTAMTTQSSAMVARVGAENMAAIFAESEVRATELQSIAKTVQAVQSRTQIAIAAAQTALSALTTATTAMTTQSTAMVARVGRQASAEIFAESEVRASQVEALAKTVDGLTVTLNDTVKAQIAEINEVLATELDSIARTVAQLSAEMDGITGDIDATIRAQVNAISEALVTKVDAVARTVNQLSATVDGLTLDINETISAQISEINEVLVNDLGAVSRTVTQLQSEVGGYSAAIQETRQVVDGVSGRVETKIDVNGHISGWALNSTTGPTGDPTAYMTFAVDRFEIGSPGVGRVAVFSVTTKEGKAAITLAGVRIGDGMVTADTIVANAITAGKVAVGAISARELAAGAITTDKITIGTEGGIPGTFIRNGTISTAKIEAGAVTGDKILGNTIVGGHIVGNSIQGYHMTANSIYTDHLTANSINADKLGVNSVSAEKIQAGAITAGKIAADAITASNIRVGGDLNNLVRDPRFKDLKWWGLTDPPNTGVNTGVTPVDWNGTPQASWPRANVSMYFQSTGGVQYNTQTQKMPLVPGGTYLVEYDLLFHNDWDGDFSVWFHANGWSGNLLGGLGFVPDTQYRFADGNAIQYPGYTREWRRVSAVFTIPTSQAAATECSFLFLRAIRGGSVEVGSFNVIRLMDNVLIKDGAVTANKLQVNSLQAVSGIIGTLRTAASGARTEIADNVIRVYDDANRLRVRIGNLNL